jgi:nucleoside-diphosphate-sugar epimerase
MRPDDGRVVPELCRQALEGKPLTVHGEGLQTRSFCYVDDLVEGIIRLFESSEKNPVNVGNPVEFTMLEFARMVLELSGSKSQVVHLPAREDDPRRRRPDTTRARQILGWEPQVALREGLQKTLEYFRQ